MRKKKCSGSRPRPKRWLVPWAYRTYLYIYRYKTLMYSNLIVRMHTEVYNSGCGSHGASYLRVKYYLVAKREIED